jgi:hypothetical protein
MSTLGMSLRTRKRERSSSNNITRKNSASRSMKRTKGISNMPNVLLKSKSMQVKPKSKSMQVKPKSTSTSKMTSLRKTPSKKSRSTKIPSLPTDTAMTTESELPIEPRRKLKAKIPTLPTTVTTATELPTESKDMVMTLLGMNLEQIQIAVPDTFKKYRDISEVMSPQQQGINVMRIANYVIENPARYNKNTIEQAKFIITKHFMVPSIGGTKEVCYICDCDIDKAAKCTELEHVLPVAQGLAFNYIITENIEITRKDGIVSPFLLSLSDEQAYKYLLEYFPSHTCCNQLKGSLTFLKLDKNGYSFDETCARGILKDIWNNTVGGGKKRKESNSCGNKLLINQLKKNNIGGMKEFIDKRMKIIGANFVNKICTNINNFMNAKGINIRFSQLLFLSNQALSMDQRVWQSLGFKGETINKGTFIQEVISGLNKAMDKNYYEITIKPLVKDKLLKFLKTIDPKETTLIKPYFDKRSGGKRYSEDKFVGVIYSDFLKLKTHHEGSLSERANTYGVTNELQPYYESFNFFAIEYIYYLLLAQKDDFKFYENMKSNLISMAENVNNYTMIYLMFFIVKYNPFTVSDNLSLPSNIIDLNKDIVESGTGVIGYDEIHRNYVNSIFPLFNYYVYIPEKPYISQYLMLSNVESFAKNVSLSLWSKTFTELRSLLISLQLSPVLNNMDLLIQEVEDKEN